MKNQIVVHLAKEHDTLKKELQLLADLEDRSLSYYVVSVLKSHVQGKRSTKKKGKV